MGELRTFICRDDDRHDCDWEARDSDEPELIESARAHLLRRHAAERSADQLRRLLRAAIRGVGGI